eukprot:3157997-Rhodomonas_salina.1
MQNSTISAQFVLKSGLLRLISACAGGTLVCRRDFSPHPVPVPVSVTVTVSVSVSVCVSVSVYQSLNPYVLSSFCLSDPLSPSLPPFLSSSLLLSFSPSSLPLSPSLLLTAPCTVAPGLYCPPLSSQNQGVECLIGHYCPVSSYAICVRGSYGAAIRYAMSGTDLQLPAYAMSGTDLWNATYGAVGIRACYAMPDTDLQCTVLSAYTLTMRCAVLTYGAWCYQGGSEPHLECSAAPDCICTDLAYRAASLRACYAMSDTDIGHGCKCPQPCEHSACRYQPTRVLG